jgi:transposase
VLASGIAWEMLPWCFPSSKTVQRRLKDWLKRDAFLQAWRQLAQRYEQLHGINWDQILLDGSKKPSKKGVRRRGHLRSIAASPARLCI